MLNICKYIEELKERIPDEAIVTCLDVPSTRWSGKAAAESYIMDNENDSIEREAREYTSPIEKNCTNNGAELEAVLITLEAVKKDYDVDVPVVLCTDIQFVYDPFNEDYKVGKANKLRYIRERNY